MVVSSLLTKEGANHMISTADGTLAHSIQQCDDALAQNLEYFRTHATNLFPHPLQQTASSTAASRRQLQRVVGLVQEVDPNISCYSGSKVAFFGADISSPSVDQQHQQQAPEESEFLEVVTLYLVPIPGCLDAYAAPPPPSSTCSGALQKPSSSSSCVEHHEVEEDDQVRRHRKRRLDEDAAAGGSYEPQRSSGRTLHEMAPDSQPACTTEAPPPPPSGAGSSTQMQLPWQLLNLPHPPVHPQLATACIVTVPQSSGNSIRINDVVECFGFLQPNDDALVLLGGGGDGEDDDDDAAAREELLFQQWAPYRQPQGLVSHMLATYARPISSLDAVCGSSTARSSSRLGTITTTSTSSHPVVSRSDVVSILTDTLCRGDSLFAQYLLLHVCSHVLSRQPSTPVGDVPLHLVVPKELQRTMQLLHDKEGEQTRSGEEDQTPRSSGVVPPTSPSSWLSQFTEELRRVVAIGCASIDLTQYLSPPSSSTLPSSSLPSEPPTEPLRKGDTSSLQQQQKALTRLHPQYDDEHNILRSGPLQLSKGSNVVLCLISPPPTRSSSDASEQPTSSNHQTDGWVSSHVESSLSLAIHAQKLSLEYAYQTVELETDLGFLLLSSVPSRQHASPALRLATSLVWVPQRSTTEGGRLKGRRMTTAEADAVRSFVRRVRQMDLSGPATDHGAATGGGEGSVDLSQQIAADLADTARTHPTRFNGDPLLHNNTMNVLLGLTRWSAAAEGRSHILWSDYEYVKHLEEQRAARNV